MDDGRIIDGKAFLSPSKKGRVVAIFGDTKACPQAMKRQLNECSIRPYPMPPSRPCEPM
nr:hypothetical protein [uncultured Neisseria sp.]